MATSAVVESNAVEVVAGFAALADPIRFDIVNRLSDGEEHCVCELLGATGVAANLLSYHLGVLRRAGLIAARRRGRWVDYRLAREALEGLRRSIPSPERR